MSYNTGESREREGFFGRYTEHTDRSGRKTGESRERKSFFGKYTEHEGTGYRGDKSKGDSGSSSWCFLTTACVRTRGLGDNCDDVRHIQANRPAEAMRTYRRMVRALAEQLVSTKRDA